MNVSGFVGPDDWPRRWKAMAERLPLVDWDRFRTDRLLLAGMQDSQFKIGAWLERCKGIDPALLREPTFGRPEATYFDQTNDCMTANSVRCGYYVHRIRSVAASDLDRGHMLEIGGGFGGLVRAAHQHLWIDRITLLDAAPCVELQTRYLREVCPSLEVVPYSEDLVFDLATNAHSFGEMPREEVGRYFDVIHGQLAEGGWFYTENREHRETNFSDYPYDEKWTHRVNYLPGDASPRFVECLSMRDSSAKSEHPSKILRT